MIAMYVIHPDATVTREEYTDYNSITDAVGGYFDLVRFDDSTGFTCYVNDEGLLTQMPENKLAELITGYPMLAGRMAMVEITEDNEPELLRYVDALVRDVTRVRLDAMADFDGPVIDIEEPKPFPEGEIPPIRVTILDASFNSYVDPEMN